MDQKIIEGTKIIAEFMGYKIGGDKNDVVYKDDKILFHITELNYLHWSPLMQVYFKFQNELMQQNINITDNNYDLAKIVKEDIFCEGFLDGIIIQSIQFSFDSLVNGIIFLRSIKNDNIMESYSKFTHASEMNKIFKNEK